MSKKVTVQIEADDDGDMRVNTVLDEAFAGPPSPSASPFSGSALRNNPEREAAFADLFEQAAESTRAGPSPAGHRTLAVDVASHFRAGTGGLQTAEELKAVPGQVMALRHDPAW